MLMSFFPTSISNSIGTYKTVLGSPTQVTSSKSYFVYLLDLATRSNSSFFLIAKLLEDPLLALINSSARHSAMVLMDLKEASLVPVHTSQMAWFTRRSGATSTA